MIRSTSCIHAVVSSRRTCIHARNNAGSICQEQVACRTQARGVSTTPGKEEVE